MMGHDIGIHAGPKVTHEHQHNPGNGECRVYVECVDCNALYWTEWFPCPGYGDEQQCRARTLQLEKR